MGDLWKELPVFKNWVEDMALYQYLPKNRFWLVHMYVHMHIFQRGGEDRGRWFSQNKKMNRRILNIWIRTPRIGPGVNAGSQEKNTFQRSRHRVHKKKSVLSSFFENPRKLMLKIFQPKLLCWLWRLVVILMVDLFQIWERVFAVENKLNLLVILNLRLVDVTWTSNWKFWEF